MIVFAGGEIGSSKVQHMLVIPSSKFDPRSLFLKAESFTEGKFSFHM